MKNNLTKIKEQMKKHKKRIGQGLLILWVSYAFGVKVLNPWIKKTFDPKPEVEVEFIQRTYQSQHHCVYFNGGHRGFFNLKSIDPKNSPKFSFRKTKTESGQDCIVAIYAGKELFYEASQDRYGSKCLDIYNSPKICVGDSTGKNCRDIYYDCT